MEEQVVTGASASRPGSRASTEPLSAQGLGRSGFDPSRDEQCDTCGRRRFEHGGTWCYPFIPQGDGR